MILYPNYLFGRPFAPFFGCAAQVVGLHSAARLQNETKFHPKAPKGLN